MMDQTTFGFGLTPREIVRSRSRALARRTDPPESREAAREIAPKLVGLYPRILEIVRDDPGLTAAELNARHPDPADHRWIGRRLPELEARGALLRVSGGGRCSITGKSAARWYPTT